MKPENKKSKKIIKKVITAVLSVLVVIMAAIVGYLTFCNINGNVAFIGSYATVKIISPSMEPQIPVGTYILAQKVAPDQIGVGDVILFRSRDPQIYGKINTHRVVDVSCSSGEYSFTTRGDNNSVDDAFPVFESDLVGKYVRNADALTGFVGFFSRPAVFFVFVIVPAAVLVIVSMADVVKRAKETRMERLVEEEVRRLEQSENESDIKTEENDDNV
ncbi:MAG: signal peptidase I [Firmicutes bacterium]|nr:signal peptidase I [Bacillota bacterium]